LSQLLFFLHSKNQEAFVSIDKTLNPTWWQAAIDDGSFLFTTAELVHEGEDVVGVEEHNTVTILEVVHGP